MKEYFPFSKGWEVLKGSHPDVFSLEDLLLLNCSVCPVMGRCPTYCNQEEQGPLDTQLQLETVLEGDCSA